MAGVLGQQSSAPGPYDKCQHIIMGEFKWMDSERAEVI
jgi:hypothetical protein